MTGGTQPQLGSTGGTQPQQGSQNQRHPPRSSKPNHNAPKMLYFNSNDSSHFEKWKQGIITDTQKQFGKLSSIFLIDKFPDAIPLPTAPEHPLNDDTDPGGIQREYIRQQIADKVKEDRKLESDKPKLFGFLMQRLSQASVTQVHRRHLEIYYADIVGDPDEDDLQDVTSKELWDAFLQQADPLRLWEAIKSSHQTGRTLSSRLDRHKAQSSYATIRMGPYDKLDAYKFKFDNALSLLHATKCDLPSNEDIITKFIESLNSDYDELKLKIKNDDYAGIPNAWPTTLDLAYIRAAKFVTSASLSIQQGTGEQKQVAFLGTVSELAQKRQHLNNNQNKHKNRRQQNHTTPNGPAQNTNAPYTQPLSNAAPTVSGPTQASTSNQSTPQGNANVNSNNNTADNKQPKRPCHICGEMHWTSKCPHLALCQSVVASNNTDPSNVFTGLTATTPHLFTGITSTNLLTHLASTDIILDNASEPNIFKSKELLDCIIPCAPVSIGGVNSTGQKIVAKESGSFGPWDNVLHHPSAAANILSMAYTIKKFKVELVDNGHTYLVTTPIGIFPFKLKGSFFILDSSSRTFISKRQQTAIEDVKSIQARLGYPGTTELYNTVKNASINNLPITSTDVLRLAKLPPAIQILKGKMTAPKPTPRDIDSFPPSDIRHGTLSVDLMKLEGSVYLIGVIDQLSLTLAAQVKSRSVKDISSTIKLFISKARQQGWVLNCLSDNEGAIKSLIAKNEITGDTVSSGGHVPIVERKIRTIKERVRTILHSLPYYLPKSLLKYLVYFVVSRLNLTSQNSSVNEFGNRPAFEIFFNRRIDYHRDLQVEFGQYVHLYDSTNSRPNTMQPRSVGAIALLPTGSTSGSVKFFSLGTMRVITRDKFKPLPIPLEAVNYLNSLTAMPDIEEHLEDSSTDVSVAPANQTINTEIQGIRPHLANIPEEIPLGETSTIPEDSPLVESPSHREVPTHRYNLRPRKQSMPDDIYTFHISIKEGISRFRQAAIESLASELSNTIKYDCWIPKKLSEIQKGSQFIPSFCFFKEKFTPSGAFDKLKARITSGGHRQDRSLYSISDTSSPTCDPTTVFLLSALAVHENMSVITADIEAAYLNASIRKTIILKLDPTVAAILCKLDTKYLPYLNADQSLYVQLKKALYGCLESARLWYEHLSSTLLSIPNMKQSKLDPCLFYLKQDSQQLYVAIYVDDIKIVSSATHLTQIIKNKLSSIYTVKYQEGSTHEYLGMKFQYFPDHVAISSPHYIENLISDYKSNQTSSYAPTPASDDLFHIDETSPLLSDLNKATFHSFVARLLYLSKHNRPDILCAVSFLTTRVQHPTEQDNLKLKRVMNYIGQTKDLALRFNKRQTLELTIHIDASYGQHGDRKSHSGSVVQFNSATLHAKSTKQKLNTKSSAEAELVAISDSIGQVVHVSQLLKELGYANIPNVYQDNKSTIELIKRGRPTSNSRHIDIKYFFVHNIQQRKLVHIEYCSTNTMIADILTKPIQGQQFIYLRNLLLGHPIEGSVVNTTTGVSAAAAEQQQQTTTDHDHYSSRYT